MNALVEAIQGAIAEAATPEQKTAGAQACRTLLAALEAEVGKPVVAEAPRALAGIDPTQALDLLIARLRAALPEREGSSAPPGQGFRVALVRRPPVRSR